MEGHAPAGANTTVGVGVGVGVAESGRGKGRRQRRLQRQQGGVLVAHDETAAALLEETCASRLALWRQIVAAAAAAPASAVQEATEIVPDSLVPPLLRARIDPTTGLAVGLAGELQTAQLAQLDTQILRLAHDLTALPAIRGARAPAGATTPAATVTTGSLALAIAPGPARVTMLQLECLQVQHEAMTAAQERILRTQQRWLATCAEVIREQQQRLAAAHAAEGGVPETDSALEGAASEKNADPLRARVDAALTAVAALAPPIVAS
ncbi:hypothetical protein CAUPRSCDRAFT_11148 [Caulochytrium protostelioides]|uniref:Uncharacterized protein n=1 Tax=Caulochytrium protostelioides TaxID=1555241 RepID=A0A4P9WXD7_9FUNG|nr:hypothetical protein CAUPRSCDRAFT_11148 [Caulochytrium protostelioides]